MEAIIEGPAGSFSSAKANVEKLLSRLREARSDLAARASRVEVERFCYFRGKSPASNSISRSRVSWRSTDDGVRGDG